MERRGGQAGSSLSFWKPGRLKWGPACLSLCSCALFLPPWPLSLSLSFRSRLLPETVHKYYRIPSI